MSSGYGLHDTHVPEPHATHHGRYTSGLCSSANAAEHVQPLVQQSVARRPQRWQTDTALSNCQGQAVPAQDTCLPFPTIPYQKRKPTHDSIHKCQPQGRPQKHQHPGSGRQLTGVHPVRHSTGSIPHALRPTTDSTSSGAVGSPAVQVNRSGNPQLDIRSLFLRTPHSTHRSSWRHPQHRSGGSLAPPHQPVNGAQEAAASSAAAFSGSRDSVSAARFGGELQAIPGSAKAAAAAARNHRAAATGASTPPPHCLPGLRADQQPAAAPGQVPAVALAQHEGQALPATCAAAPQHVLAAAPPTISPAPTAAGAVPAAGSQASALWDRHQLQHQHALPEAWPTSAGPRLQAGQQPASKQGVASGVFAAMRTSGGRHAPSVTAAAAPGGAAGFPSTAQRDTAQQAAQHRSSQPAPPAVHLEATTSEPCTDRHHIPAAHAEHGGHVAMQEQRPQAVCPALSVPIGQWPASVSLQQAGPMRQPMSMQQGVLGIAASSGTEGEQLSASSESQQQSPAAPALQLGVFDRAASPTATSLPIQQQMQAPMRAHMLPQHGIFDTAAVSPAAASTQPDGPQATAHLQYGVFYSAAALAAPGMSHQWPAPLPQPVGPAQEAAALHIGNGQQSEQPASACLQPQHGVLGSVASPAPAHECQHQHGVLGTVAPPAPAPSGSKRPAVASPQAAGSPALQHSPKRRSASGLQQSGLAREPIPYAAFDGFPEDCAVQTPAAGENQPAGHGWPAGGVFDAEQSELSGVQLSPADWPVDMANAPNSAARPSLSHLAAAPLLPCAQTGMQQHRAAELDWPMDDFDDIMLAQRDVETQPLRASPPSSSEPQQAQQAQQQEQPPQHARSPFEMPRGSMSSPSGYPTTLAGSTADAHTPASSTAAPRHSIQSAPHESASGTAASAQHTMPNGFTKKPLRLGLDQWDLPPRVVQAYAGKGVRTMYPWQAAASECGEGGANLVYCAPTSGGKSLVAEVLMIRRLRATYRPWARQGMQRYGRALFVLPYVSVVAEKTAHLSTILQAMNCKVKGYMGNDDAGMPLAPRGESVAVCTIEKANVAINKLILEGRLGELCCVVIDEMHMVCDPSRGLPLELSITKLLYSPAMRSIQILGMSATMGGLEAMRTWLRARLFITNYRPVPLTEHAVFSGVVYKKAAQPQDDCPLTRLRELGNSHARDRDRILPLIAEVVADGDSVLVFCAGRKQCQSCAELVAELLPEVLQGGSISAEMAAQRALLIEEMKAAMGGFSNASLQKTMAAGVAWHHAGLTTEERHFVERGFRGGELCVLMATSTLAAGINLPARRVILRSLWQGIGEVSRGQYLQMVGRAGRAGHANFGEAFLMGRSEPLNEWDKVCALLVEPLPSLRSQLLPERVKADCSLAPAEIGPEATQHLQRMLMEALANGSVHGKGDFQGLLRCTLASHQLPYQVVHAHTVAALTALRCQKLITFRQKDTDEESRWHCTELGQAVYNSALPTAVGIRMYSELQAAQLTYVMGSSTHGIYLVMLDHPFQIKEWRGWDVMFDQLPDADKRVAAQVGVDKAYINKLLRSAKGQPEVSQRHHRFAAACALSAMVSEQPAWEAAQQWAYITQNGVSAGQLQKLQSDVSKWAAMAGLLCASAGWWLLELELMNLSQQAACGVRPELIKLMQIPEMTAPNARALYNAGFKDPDALVPADEAAVAKAVAAGMVRSLRNQKPSKDKAKRALESGITGAQGTNALAYRTAKTILTNVHAYLEEAAQQLADQEAELAECGSPDSSQ